jgi:hypothetical protein
MINIVPKIDIIRELYWEANDPNRIMPKNQLLKTFRGIYNSKTTNTMSFLCVYSKNLNLRLK